MRGKEFYASDKPDSKYLQEILGEIYWNSIIFTISSGESR